MMGTPRPWLIHCAVGSSSGSPARYRVLRLDRSYFLSQAGSCFFSTRTAVGAREHARHLVFLDQLPPDAGIRPDRQAFVHDGGHAGDQRAVDDVAVAHHPADVAGGEIGLARLAFEDVLHAGGQRHGVATGVALHALRFAGGAAGVERVADVGGIHPLAGHAGVQMLVRAAGPRAGRARPPVPWARAGDPPAAPKRACASTGGSPRPAAACRPPPCRRANRRRR